MPKRFHAPEFPLIIDPDVRAEAIAASVKQYQHAAEPMIRSILMLERSFNFQELNIVAATTSLRDLLMLTMRLSSTDVRIDIEILKSNLYSHRWSIGNLINDAGVGFASSFGRPFKEACVTYDDDLNVSNYHRVARCEFAGIKLLLQSKGDA